MKRLLLLILILLTFSCSPGTYIRVHNDKPVSTSAIVTMVEPRLIFDEDGVPKGIGYYAHCNGFFASYYNHAYMITASHCVSGLNVGDQVDYLNPNGFGIGHTTLIDSDPTFDQAVLLPETVPVDPLVTDVNYQINAGDTVFSLSAITKQTVLGNVIGELTHGWFDTTQTVAKGWSGAPVMNGDGNVIGLISMCHFITEEDRCIQNNAIVAKLK